MYTNNSSIVYTNNLSIVYTNNLSIVQSTHGIFNHTQHHDCALHSVVTYLGVTFVALFITIGVIGNSIVIVVLLRSRCRFVQDTLNFVISLAFSDLLMCLMVMPFDIMYWVNFPIWTLSTQWCRLWNALFYTFHASSSLGITAISLDTYMTVSNPMHIEELREKFSSKLAIGLIWTWSLGIGILFYIFQEDPPVGVYAFEFDTTAYGIYLLIHMLMPQVVAAGCYFRLFRIARMHAVNIRQQQQDVVASSSTEGTNNAQILTFREEIKLARTFLLVALGFFICWNPFLAVQFVYVLEEDYNVDYCSLEIADTVLCWMAYSQSCLNPFLYALRKKFFQRLLTRAVTPTLEVQTRDQSNKARPQGAGNSGIDL